MFVMFESVFGTVPDYVLDKVVVIAIVLRHMWLCVLFYGW